MLQPRPCFLLVGATTLWATAVYAAPAPSPTAAISPSELAQERLDFHSKCTGKHFDEAVAQGYRSRSAIKIVVGRWCLSDGEGGADQRAQVRLSNALVDKWIVRSPRVHFSP